MPMKTSIICLVLMVFLIGCKNEDKLTFEPETVYGDSCDQCPQVSITLPKLLDNDRLGAVIKTSLREEIISMLAFDEATEAADIDSAIMSFSNGYENLQRMFPDETAIWEARIKAEPTYEDANRITITMESYIFTGGAHGYGTIQFFNFDKKKATELEDWEIFSNKKGFQNFAEHKFRTQENIPEDMSINSTGYMFERDSFYLPENIGFTEEGIKLLYNEYEVASYADGPVELTLPYEEVQGYLSSRIKS